VRIDPRKLKPNQLVQLLNSTPIGEVINERQLHRHRSRAGLRIGDGTTVDLPRYIAWLVIEQHRERPEPEGLTGYEALKERARQRNLELSLSGRDIGPLPAIANPERRQRAERDFRFFCEQYFPLTFHLEWSPDHLKVIAKIEDAVLQGGLFAMAMPRGSGKTSLCETACIWALAFGHREFVALIGSDEEHSGNMLASIKVELETNERLLEDFPDVCFPIRALEGIHQRAGGQLFEGKPTNIGWTAREVVLPCLPGSRASGSVMRVAGITGRVRGMKHKRTDGSAIRPSLVLVDDPQTDESARSPAQCATRERILAGAVLGLAGPGRKIAGLMTLTVVCAGDLADRILDREKHPDWQGQRTKMVYAFPKNDGLWKRYAALRAEELRMDRGIAAATEFYRKNQAAMDAGAQVAWAERFNPDEISALQHAMNLRYQNEAAFFAEFQNEPLPDDTGAEETLTADQIAAKINGIKRGVVSQACTALTMFVDVQQKALYWLVAAWEDDFTGYVIDYGTEPDQSEQYFTLRDVRRTLARMTPRAGPEAAIYAGLERLIAGKVASEWLREDGTVAKIERCLIDANWGLSTDVVYQFCRQCSLGMTVLPCHGRYVGARSIPFGQYRKKPGDRLGLNWRMPAAVGTRAVKHVLFDSNFWKTFLQGRFAVPIGDPGCLSLFGRNPDRHRLLADHLAAEMCIRTEGRGRTVDEWQIRSPGLDNHWLDCLVGCAVAASMLGATLVGEKAARPGQRKRVSFRAMQEAARGPRVSTW
jgi:hypothetical protein